LREAFDAFVRIRRKLNPSTVAFYRKYLLSVFAAWLDRPFTEITRERVAEALSKTSPPLLVKMSPAGPTGDLLARVAPLLC
jgi:hypothetical protein